MEIHQKLSLTLDLISKCWLTAEQRVCKLISTKYHAHDEVFITRLLYGEVKEEFDNLNEEGAFETAFFKDISAIYRDGKLSDEVRRLSKGIIARISYHEPSIEKTSGADFGLAVARPFFEKIREKHLKFTIRQQGLLCQAKRQKPNGKFGQLTPHQIEVIPEHFGYFAFLLYRYSERERHNLLPFTWLHDICDVDGIIHFLNNYYSEATVTSTHLIKFLGEGYIGTGDRKTIDSIICPEDRPYILVEITWRDGFPEEPPNSQSGGLSYINDFTGGRFNSQQNKLRRTMHRPQAQNMKTRTKKL